MSIDKLAEPNKNFQNFENENLSARVPLLSKQPSQVVNLGVTKQGALKAEAILGDTVNFLPAWFLDVGAQRAKAICKIRTSGTTFDGQMGSWSGTGFMVSPNILLTNHHVLNSFEAAQNGRCTFNYQAKPSGEIAAGKAYSINPSRLFLTSPLKTDLDQEALDFTFVWVDGEPGKEFGYIPLIRPSQQFDEKDFANIIQHPNGNPKVVVVQQNQIIEQDLLSISYESDTLPGSSGSPVMDNQWNPIALHHASRKDDNSEKFYNQGIKFSAIAAYIENLSHGDYSIEIAKELIKLFQGTDTLMGFFGAMGRNNPDPETGVEVVLNRYRGEADDIDVGFWNVEWFVNRFEQKLDDVAKIIVSMNLDVWALEETGREATKKLVEHLNNKYEMNFSCDFSEPEASPNKQTTAVLWNNKTIKGMKQAWPSNIEKWFHVDSRDLGKVRLEAVEGKLFDRYPALYYFQTTNRSKDHKAELDFYLVPLHLKAKQEGSKRRQLAAQILGASIKKMITDQQIDKDWIIGGDFNAELVTQEFQALTDANLVALSAEDERGDAFTYLKTPKSLIDHIFLSPNLAQTYGADDYFIVAADKEFPNYIKQVSDHRPVLVRLSLSDSPKTKYTELPSVEQDLFDYLQSFVSPETESLKKANGFARKTLTNITNDKRVEENPFNPIFEGFAIEISKPSQEQTVRELIVKELDSSWDIKSFGARTPDGYGTNFEITSKKTSLSTAQAWTISYRLRVIPEVIYAEPLFAVTISNRPDWKSDKPTHLEMGFDVERLGKTIDLNLLMCGAQFNSRHLPESDDPEWSLKQIQVFEAWERFFRDSQQTSPGSGIIIGHPDTGYRLHPEIKDSLLVSKSFDFLKNDSDALDELETPNDVFIPNPGHGTSTASVIISSPGKQGDQLGNGVTGVAPGAKLIPLRVSYSVVQISTLNLARAIEYAADQGVHVISISLGGLFSWRLRNAITYAQKQGVIIAAAAGNCVPFVVWPAAYDEVIAVAASNAQGQIWKGSSFGSKVDVTAPGESVWHAQVIRNSNGVENLVQRGSGTSFAVAAVAGVAALWLAHHGRDHLISRYGRAKIPFIFNRILRESCEKTSSWDSSRFGAGIVNVEKVLAAELPNNIESLTMISPAFDLEDHVALDSGGSETFTHIFEQSLATTQIEGSFHNLTFAQTQLQTKLTELLGITEEKLPLKLKEVGQELAFHFVVNPELYKQFAATLSQKEARPKDLAQELMTTSLDSNGKVVQAILTSDNISDLLKITLLNTPLITNTI